jgi:hypothetical protein
MKKHSAISPFLATVMLVVITLAIGGTLYTQFRQTIVSQIRNPSILLQDTNVAPDGQTITVTIKNDGNVQLVLQGFTVTYGTGKNIFQFASGNATIISSASGGSTLQPGQLLTASIKTRFSILGFSTYTLTVIGDQVSRAFNVQA